MKVHPSSSSPFLNPVIILCTLFILAITGAVAHMQNENKRALQEHVIRAASAPAPAPVVQPQAAVHAIYKGDGENAGGSGVMIAPNIMLTAAHVAREAGITAGDQRAPLKALSINEEIDLALMLVAIQCPCVPVSTVNPAIGTPVTVIGFPMHDYVGLQITTEGKWQGVRTVKRGDGSTHGPYAMMTAPVAPGNSGGGVFVFEDGHWKLVGITVALIAVPTGFGASLMAHLAIASPATNIIDLLRSPHKLPKKEPA